MAPITATDNGGPRVADYFPRRPKACHAAADKFFACFSLKGEQQETALEGKAGADKEAGRRGLAECQKEMKGYDACMSKVLKGKGKEGEEKFFRVQEEYRLENVMKKGEAEGGERARR
jgi:hypothetical protein|eukprot:evm.model.NODE_41771_length_14365_cov_26.770136.3